MHFYYNFMLQSQRVGLKQSYFFIAELLQIVLISNIFILIYSFPWVKTLESHFLQFCPWLGACFSQGASHSVGSWDIQWSRSSWGADVLTAQWQATGWSCHLWDRWFICTSHCISAVLDRYLHSSLTKILLIWRWFRLNDGIQWNIPVIVKLFVHIWCSLRLICTNKNRVQLCLFFIFLVWFL